MPTTWGLHGYDVFIDDGTLNPSLYQNVSPISPLWSDAHLGWIGEYTTRCTCHNTTEQEVLPLVK